MTSYVTSADGTRIAFDRMGRGAPLIVVGGIFCDRMKTAPLAEALSASCMVLNYDRRGRGDSGDSPSYAVTREIEDIGALIAAAGGTASVYGHSSGAGLALNAAAAGLPIDRLVLHEPPYGADEEGSKQGAREMARTIRRLLADDRRGEAISTFFSGVGVPPDLVDEWSKDPRMLAMAPTMLHDYEVMGDFTGGTIPERLVRAIDVPTLVLAGGASLDFFRDTASRIAELLADGRYVVLDGQDHEADPAVVAPVVAEFVGVAAEAR
jgi:pimeloyl-ACP methyl ester carboxylesterase